MKIFNDNAPIRRLCATGNASIGSVQIGEVFQVVATNAFGKKFPDQKTFEIHMNDPEKWRYDYPMTGPIRIEGVDSRYGIAVHILDIELENSHTCLVRNAGLMKGVYGDQRHCKVYESILGEDGKYYTDIGHGIYLQARPSVGVVATLDAEDRSPGECSEIGGNLDIYSLGAGSTLYLPVNHEEALLTLGDVHFRQESGEIPAIGLESNAVLTLGVDLIEQISFPIYETSDHIGVLGWGIDQRPAQQKAYENWLEYVKKYSPLGKFKDHEIYVRSGAIGEMVNGFVTGKNPICAVQVRKGVLQEGFNGRSFGERANAFFKTPEVLSMELLPEELLELQHVIAENTSVPAFA